MKTERALRLNIVEGGFTTAAQNISTPFLGLFALALGAAPSQIGILSALPNFLGNALQIFAGAWADRLRDKRILHITGSIFAHLAWLGIAFLPFLFPLEQRAAVLILLATFQVAMANLGLPAWTSLQAGLVPRSMRGKYYGERNMILNGCALLATFAAGYVLRLAFPVNYQLAFGGATFLGLCAVFVFSRIPFQQAAPASAEERPSFKEMGQNLRRQIGRESAFASYVKSSIMFNLGLSLSGSLFVVHFMDVMGGTEGWWAIFAATALITQMIVQRYWGRLADQFGHKNVMTVTGAGIISIPLLWLIAPTVWFPVILHVINGIVWGGYHLASFNLLLEVTPDDQRSLYVGSYNTLIGLANSVGPLIGGFAAELIGLPFVFITSSLLRALGLYMFQRTVKTGQNRPLGIKELVKEIKNKE